MIKWRLLLLLLAPTFLHPRALVLLNSCALVPLHPCASFLSMEIGCFMTFETFNFFHRFPIVNSAMVEIF